MSEAGDFIDAALQYEVSPYSYSAEFDDGLVHYGSSVGAIRGTIRDLRSKFPGLTHDEVTALSSELWAPLVFERRSAAIVLLQAHLADLRPSDLTRIEGFIRSAGASSLVEQLVRDVLVPMASQMEAAASSRAAVVFERWANEPDPALKAAAERVAR